MTEAKVEALKVQNQEKIVAVKKEQAEAFQAFKKRTQDELEALRLKNLKDIDDFKLKAKKQIDALQATQIKDIENFRQNEVPALEKKLTEELTEKNKDMSPTDIENTVNDLTFKKEQDFLLNQSEEMFKLRNNCLVEEEKLHRGYQKSMQDLQTKYLEEEHKVLLENLETIQKMIEENAGKEYELMKDIASSQNQASINALEEDFQKLLATQQTVVDDEKDKAKKEHETILKKHEEEIQKLESPTTEEEKKKAFLAKKFNIQIEAPTADKYNARLEEINKEFEEFKIQKRKVFEEDRAKIGSKSHPKLAEYPNEKAAMQQTHKSRIEKLTQFQKEEKSKLEAKFAELEKPFNERWEKARKDLKDKENAERESILHPAEEEGDAD
jgi:hypothetical protein